MSKLHVAMMCLVTAGLVLVGCGEKTPTSSNPAAGAAQTAAGLELDYTLGPDGIWHGEEAEAEVVPGPSAKIAAGVSGKVLVFGDYPSKNTLATTLTGFGYTVTNVTLLPADLSSFSTIWHVGAFAPITTVEQARLAAFLASGGGVHLTGERPCCETLNSSLTTFVNSVVTGGGVTVGNRGDVGTPYQINPGAIGGIATTPNAIANVDLSASGGIAGISGSHILATGAAGVPVGAIWDSGDLVGHAGRLTLMMDVNWFSNPGSADNLKAFRNIQTYLESATVAPPADTTPPAITLNGAADLSLECHVGTYTELGATATDNVDGAVAVSISGSVNTAVEGTYVITYTATDAAGNTSTATRTVHVVDGAPPVISLNGAADLTLECHVGTYIELGATAVDACDGPVVVAISGSVNTTVEGDYVLTYTATDGAAHAATVTRTVHVVDTTAPVISLNGAATQTIECHLGTYTELGATALDACEGAVTVVISGNVDTTVEGTYVVTYTAVDGSGNSASATRTIEVVDTTAPAISLNGAAMQTIECHVGSYTEQGATALDACEGAVTVAVSGSVNTTVEGNYVITYTAVDGSGNSASATRSIQVVDTTAPALTLSISPSSLWPPNHEMVAVGQIAAADLCDPSVALAITVTSNEPENGTGDGDTGPDWQVVDHGDGTASIALRAERKGNGTGRVYTLTVTATDEAGNTTSKSGKVTVALSQAKKK
ncbi:MAG: DUF5011 domain-containing protein [Candidatus Latescibacteria bacterium]|nr:DUF5011 domain-containing protein [Candidatus Latescibacterota bacterium]